MATFSIKQGDTSPSLKVQLQDEDGAPVDITNTNVKFHMRSAETNNLVIDEVAVIDDAVNGKVSYDWREGNTRAIGRFNAEFEVTYANDAVETFPNDSYIIIKIHRELA